MASILTANPERPLRIAAQLRTGIDPIHDPTNNPEVFGPIGGMGPSGNGIRSGGLSVMDNSRQRPWITVNEKIPPYPF